MNDRMDDSEVLKAVKNSDFQELNNSNTQYCISNDGLKFIILTNQQNGDTTPEKRDNTRALLNCYFLNSDKTDNTWFKVFVPLKYSHVSLEADGNEFNIQMDQETISGDFDLLQKLMFQFLSGNDKDELEIERKFKLLSN